MLAEHDDDNMGGVGCKKKKKQKGLSGKGFLLSTTHHRGQQLE